MYVLSRTLVIVGLLLFLAAPLSVSIANEAMVLQQRPYMRLQVHDGSGKVIRTIEYLPKYLQNTPIAREIEAAVQKAAQTHGVPVALIKAVIKQESGGGKRGIRAVSSANAQGLMQLMPGTAKDMGVSDTFDIEENILGGTRYLKLMTQKFKQTRLALMAYNWGPGNLEKALDGQKKIPSSVKKYAISVLNHYERFSSL